MIWFCGGLKIRYHQLPRKQVREDSDVDFKSLLQSIQIPRLETFLLTHLIYHDQKQTVWPSLNPIRKAFPQQVQFSHLKRCCFCLCRKRKQGNGKGVVSIKGEIQPWEVLNIIYKSSIFEKFFRRGVLSRKNSRVPEISLYVKTLQPRKRKGWRAPSFEIHFFGVPPQTGPRIVRRLTGHDLIFRLLPSSRWRLGRLSRTSWTCECCFTKYVSKIVWVFFPPKKWKILPDKIEITRCGTFHYLLVVWSPFLCWASKSQWKPDPEMKASRTFPHPSVFAKGW